MPRALALRASRWTVLLLFCTCPPVIIQSLAQISLQPPSSNPETRYTLSGSVINSITGEPIPRALVQIYAGAERLAFTDASGQFQFEGLAPGETRIDARKPGFFDVPHPDYLMQTMVKIGPQMQPVILNLIPEGVIYGHIQDGLGQPIEGLPVKVIAVRIAEGKKRVESGGNRTTDEDGNFRIADIRPGSYYVEAGPGTRLDRLSGRHAGYSALFYPTAHDLSSAMPFQIGPGQQVDANFSLKAEPMFHLSGTVACLAPDDGVNLRLLDRSGEYLSFSVGYGPAPCQFQAEVLSGSYTFVVNSWHEGALLSAEIALNVNSDLTGISAAPSPAHSIPIAVRAESTSRSGPQRRGTKEPNAYLASIHLSANAGSLNQSDYQAQPEGDPKNPSLVLRNLPSGKYSVEVNASAPWYVQSAQSGGTDLLREELTVTGGVQTPPIEIVLHDDGATLSGKVDVGQSVRPTAVVLAPDHGSTTQTKSGNVSDGGDFALQGLAPGNYNVLAFDLMDGLEYANPEVLNRFLSRATHVTLLPNEERKITVELTKAGN